LIYFIDTHPCVWYLTGQTRKLGRPAARVFRRMERGLDEVRVSVVSLFEIALLMERGRLRAVLGWEGWLSAARATPGLAIEPIDIEVVSHARDLAVLGDPFDRLIAGSALRLGAPLVSADERIAESGLLKVVW
jgi:PIN domain nuclease of toxin-antitoxin system